MTTRVLDEIKKEELVNRVHEIVSCKENILSNVFYKLIPTNRCLDKVSEPFIGDMSKVYAIRISDDEEGVSSIVFTWEIADEMGIGLDEIKAHAEENTPKFSACSIRPMSNVLFSMMPKELAFETPQCEAEIYVISNNRGVYGASCICYPNVLKEIAKTLDGSYFLIPSSVHECLALRANMGTSDALRAMVRDVNDSIVEDCDILSYDVMFYDANVGTLEIA
ncbi:MAG: DUF5688 family protein [Lachnospiraceae bacterium]|nr:DUF5688 family protein [Lachnospiraceae bacterium]